MKKKNEIYVKVKNKPWAIKINWVYYFCVGFVAIHVPEQVLQNSIEMAAFLVLFSSEKAAISTEIRSTCSASSTLCRTWPARRCSGRSLLRC